MNGESYLVTMWEQMACWQLPIAIVCSVVYVWMCFCSFRWIKNPEDKVRYYIGMLFIKILLLGVFFVLIINIGKLIMFVGQIILMKKTNIRIANGEDK